ncbi:MAG: S41 family peptidase [Planctomycetota bacterium]
MFARPLAVLALSLCAAGPAQSSSQASIEAAAPYEARRISPESAVRDVEILARVLSDVHPGYDRYTSREAMDAMLDALRDRVAEGGISDEELYREVSLILARIRCDHTKAELPDAIEAHRKSVPSYLPFAFRVLEGRMIVDAAAAAEGVGLRRGDEVLSINGRSVPDLIAGVEPYLAVDGWTDNAKRAELEYSTELLGGAIENFWPMLYGWPEGWTVKARSENGTDRSLELPMLTWEENRALLERGPGSDDYNFDTSVRHEMLDETTAYLRIGTFVNYRRNANVGELFEPIFAGFAEAGAERLIVDLRDCGGGSDGPPNFLFSYLIDRPFRLSAARPWVRNASYPEDLSSLLGTWDRSVFDRPASFYRDLGNGFYEVGSGGVARARPRPDRFEGDVIVLVGPQNASGATHLLARLKTARPDVVFVGEPTGGSAEGCTAGIMFFVELPASGVVARVPLYRQFINASGFAPGRGVEPDVYATQTVEGFRAGRDDVLEAALRLGR